MGEWEADFGEKSRLRIGIRPRSLAKARRQQRAEAPEHLRCHAERLLA